MPPPLDSKAGDQNGQNLDIHRAPSNPLKRERTELPDTRSIQPVELSPAKLSKGEDFESQRKEFDEYKRSPTNKQLFNPDVDIASQKVKSRGQTGVEGHRHVKESRRARRQALSDGGDRSTPRPQTSASKKLQPKPQRDADSSFLRDQTPDSEMHDSQDDLNPPEMLRQPETRSISHEQLVIEVKGIYAGLVMVEAKCIDVDEKQARLAVETMRKEPLKNDQWQSLIALHKQLLHEHHDFFLASQHPAASSNLRKLAAKYSMPARMWRHGIHAFLEVLRHRLPESLEHMLAFIYIAYSMMALLYETVRAFEDTWIECLGDLGRYRMAIEDDEPKDREVWSGVARFWYSKASTKNPAIGRLYHHLAILAKPFTLEQLSFYSRSLTCESPFESARGSILTLFNPILNGRDTSYYRFSSMEPMVIRFHGLLFLYPKGPKEELSQALALLKANQGAVINEGIEQFGTRFKRVGVHLAVSNIAAAFEFGALTSKGRHRSALRLAFDEKDSIKDSTRPVSSEGSPSKIKSEDTPTQQTDYLSKEEIRVSKIVRCFAFEFMFLTFRISLAKSHWARNNTLPMNLVYFTFIWSISSIPSVVDPLAQAIPWAEMCLYLNNLELYSSLKPMIFNPKEFPSPKGISGRPTPELYITQGQVWTRSIFPKSLFEDAKVDDEERMLEFPSHDPYRILLVLWFAIRIASLSKWIRYDKKTDKFIVVYIKNEPSSDEERRRSPVKLEATDEDLPMKDVPSAFVKDEDAMSDIIREKRILKRDTELSVVSQTTDDSHHFSSSPTTRTNTDLTENTDITDTNTIYQETPGTPKAVVMDVDEPPERPMKDISPGKEQLSPTPTKDEGIAWPPPAMIVAGTTTPRKHSDPVHDAEPRIHVVGEDIPEHSY